MKLLVVDDSRAVHAFMDSVFEGTGHDLVHVHNGKEALSYLKHTSGKGLDLILLDWEMPEMDGIQTLEHVKADGYSCPVVMVTSKNQIAEIEQAIEKGASEYIMKPFTEDILFEKISAIVNEEVA